MKNDLRYLTLTMALTAVCFAQSDPGPRSGPSGAGGSYPGLNAYEQQFFTQAQARFKEVDSVSGTMAGEAGSGLGPTFNGNSCAMCHAQPAIGGSSPGLNSPQNPIANPQVALATLHGAHNTLPSFITAAGPVREARFVSTDPSNASAPADGGVHGLFTIAGRSDAPGCVLAQPPFAQQLAANNVIFRIPTPTFGLGLVEATPDTVLSANLAANGSLKNAMGITGRLNTSGNDGSITRFGWKAQNKSLLIFSGEAYNVEQGVSNEVFPNERSGVAGCVYNGSPEDASVLGVTGTVSQVSSDTVNFAAFARLSAAPVAVTSTPSQLNGKGLFSLIGCALCHTPTLTTGRSVYTSMSNQSYSPYSDFALHNMGPGLADGVSQGGAGPSEFRTAPLWGVGQRLFFLHDGRTSDLLVAIEAHSASNSTDNCLNSTSGTSSSNTGGSSQFQSCGSEASLVIRAFNALSTSQKQDILNFLRSL